MNQVSLIGRLTKDPEVRVTAGEKQTTVANFTLAVDREKRAQGSPTADYITCKAFGKTAENIEKYLKKGSQVGISGRIQTGSYTNKDGQKVYTTDVVADRVEFLGSKSSNTSAPADVPSDIPSGFTLTEEQIPF